MPKGSSGSWHAVLTGAALCAVLGGSLFVIGGWPVVLGYDGLFLFRTATQPKEIAIIYMDDDSFKDLGQTSSPNWDRNLHASLLDRLSADGCKLVVFDIVFSEPGTAQANSNFVRAIKNNGKVVLAAGLNSPSRAQIAVRQSFLPLPEFDDAAAGVGFAAVELGAGPGRVARQYYRGNEYQPGLPWIAARVAGAKAAVDDELWLNYYGPPATLPSFSYSTVSNQPGGFFRNKYVFVGAKPTTLRAHDEADQFRTPHFIWSGEYMPGVEIGATAFLNVIRGDGLKSVNSFVQLPLLLGVGALVGALCTLLRPSRACLLALGGVLLTVVVAWLGALQHFWFAWPIVAFAQIPAALAWSVRGHFQRLRFERDVLERTLAETSRIVETGKTAAAATVAKAGVVIPDHTLVRRVGKGGYGEVWLARNAIGGFHAVKIIRRGEFPSDAPYEREFRGIQKFMPVSRSHAGFVHVLHAGRNDDEAFFYYVMEPCDDEALGQKIDPNHYTARTLAAVLARRGKLEPEECLRLGIALASAVQHLHEQQLVHRDIKPANIIYVNGAPKLADIGLVTELTQGKEMSLIGTEGYIPPEGPGSAAADIYALGKVLYEAGMGRDRQMFPEVPTAVLERPSEDLLPRLNLIIFKACETKACDRYQSAGEMHRDLLALR